MKFKGNIKVTGSNIERKTSMIADIFTLDINFKINEF